MRTINTLLFFLLTSSLLPLSGWGQAPFEGTINLTVLNQHEEMKETVRATWYVKENQHRIDYHSKTQRFGSRYSVVINEEGTFLVADSLKGSGSRVVRIPPEKLRTPQFQVYDYSVKGDPQSTALQGWECQKYTLSVNDSLHVTLWVSPDFPLQYSQLPVYMKNSFLKIAQQLEPGSFPVRIRVQRPGKGVLFSQHIQSVESREVSLTKFEVEE